MLIVACILFLLTLCTCLLAGTQFANAYARNEAFSSDEFLRSFTLFYKNPLGLAAGLPFALTLLTILLAHELGHFFACRYHHIRSPYPFFVPFPNLPSTSSPFILIPSPLRPTRPRFRRYSSFRMAAVFLLLGFLRFWEGWYFWVVLILIMQFLRIPPIYDPTPLDPWRRWGAFLALLVFLLSFMPAPIYISPPSHLPLPISRYDAFSLSRAADSAFPCLNSSARCVSAIFSFSLSDPSLRPACVFYP